MGPAPTIDTPTQLAERYWFELIELVAHGEITASFARRLCDDLFLAIPPDQKPVLRPSVWSAYVEEQQASAEREPWWRRLMPSE